MIMKLKQSLIDLEATLKKQELYLEDFKNSLVPEADELAKEEHELLIQQRLVGMELLKIQMKKVSKLITKEYE